MIVFYLLGLYLLAVAVNAVWQSKKEDSFKKEHDAFWDWLMNVPEKSRVSEDIKNLTMTQTYSYWLREVDKRAWREKH